MRIIKEIGFLVLLALAGASMGWWCIDLFGAKATSQLLKYGGSIAGLFIIAQRWLNNAFAAGSELDRFDQATKDRFALALRTFRRHFALRMIIGFGLAGISIVVGALLSEPEETSENLRKVIAIIGGTGFLVSTAMAAAMAWAATYPAEFIASAKKIAAEEQIRRENLEKFTNSEF